MIQKALDSRLAEPLVLHLERDLLSPYIPGRIATGGHGFFGRANVLNPSVISGKSGGNFTFVGNRRIGKTSLLREIKRRLVLNDERLRTVDVYGNNCHTTYDAVKTILESVRPDLASRMAHDSSVVDSFPSHLGALPDNVVIFVDELDAILEFDARQGYQLLNLLCKGGVRERPLPGVLCWISTSNARAKKNLDTPLHNFTSFLRITGLNRRRQTR